MISACVLLTIQNIEARLMPLFVRRSYRRYIDDHLRTQIIINDETLEQVSHLTYLDCSISYQFSNDVESKLVKFLQLIGTINRTMTASGLVVRVSGYRYRGLGFDSRRYQIF